MNKLLEKQIKQDSKKNQTPWSSGIILEWKEVKTYKNWCHILH